MFLSVLFTATWQLFTAILYFLTLSSVLLVPGTQIFKIIRSLVLFICGSRSEVVNGNFVFPDSVERSPRAPWHKSVLRNFCISLLRLGFISFCQVLIPGLQLGSIFCIGVEIVLLYVLVFTVFFSLMRIILKFYFIFVRLASGFVVSCCVYGFICRVAVYVSWPCFTILIIEVLLSFMSLLSFIAALRRFFMAVRYDLPYACAHAFCTFFIVYLIYSCSLCFARPVFICARLCFAFVSFIFNSLFLVVISLLCALILCPIFSCIVSFYLFARL